MRTGIVNGVYTGVNDGLEQGSYTGINDGLEQGLYYETINKDAIVREGLQLFYDFGFSPSYPKAGLDVQDISGNSQNGILINSPQYNNQIYGSIEFTDSLTSYVDSPNIGDYRTISFTVEVWVYPMKSSYLRWFILAKGNGCASSEFGIEYGRTPNKFAFVYRNDVILTSNKIYPYNQWYHAVVTRNNNGNGTYTSTLYVNSIFDKSAIVNFGGSGLGKVSVGDAASCYLTKSFVGKVAIARVYNRTLTPNEISQNFIATKYKFLI